MESVQRRREAQFSMSMGEQLMHAVDLRIAAEEEFKKQIVGQLKALIDKLAVCDPTNARTTLDLTQEELSKIIIKLNDKRNISSTEASTIANIVKDSNLLRRPVVSSPDALQTPPSPPSPSNLAGPFAPGPNSLTSEPLTSSKTLTPSKPLPPINRTLSGTPVPVNRDQPTSVQQPVKTGPGGRRTRRKRKGKSKRIV